MVTWWATPPEELSPSNKASTGAAMGFANPIRPKLDPSVIALARPAGQDATGNRGLRRRGASPVPRVARRVAGCAANKVTWDRSARCVEILRVSGQNGCFPFVCGSTTDFT
jgi:hypothetical protein